MTSVVLRGSLPCTFCGYQRPVLRFARVTVLAKGIREKPPTLAVGPGRCHECGRNDEGGGSYSHPRYQLDAEDRAKIELVRDRRRQAAADRRRKT